jgi:hypothetical protein
VKARHIIALWFVLGALYLVIESIWRGWTHVSMLVVGGICGLAIGAVNQIPSFYETKMIWQSITVAAIILCVEFGSGCVINLWWGWGIWDYSGVWGNIMGQICLPFAALWVLITPFAIWAEDTARWSIYDWYTRRQLDPGKPPKYAPYSLRSVYKELFTGR